MPCSGFYSMLHRLAEYYERERRFKRKLKKILRKHGWM
jgi:type II secretory pathway component PulF